MPREVQSGKLIAEGGKYYVLVGDQRLQLPTDQPGDVENLKALVGKEVQTFWTKPQSYLIGIGPATRRPPWRCFICYLPPIWIRIRQEFVQEATRVKLIEQFVKEGLISPKISERLGGPKL